LYHHAHDGRKARRFQIAILLYPGVAALDAVGPWEVLARMPDTVVRFVGRELAPVTTEGGSLLPGLTHTVGGNAETGEGVDGPKYSCRSAAAGAQDCVASLYRFGPDRKIA